MKEQFDKYVSQFDQNNKDIKLKYNHSYRVQRLADKYARLLNWNEEDIYLANIIGLLHDIGRFYQIEKYHTYNDSISIDHAELGVSILFDNNIIKYFNVEPKYYEIIRFAIENHNKFKLPKVENKQMMKHAKLIRDVDKLDIVYLLGKLHETKLSSTNEEITSSVINSFDNHSTVEYKFVKNDNDRIAVYYGYAYEINNKVCLNEFKNNIIEFTKKVDSSNKFKDITKKVIEYIESSEEKC